MSMHDKLPPAAPGPSEESRVSRRALFFTAAGLVAAAGANMLLHRDGEPGDVERTKRITTLDDKLIEIAASIEGNQAQLIGEEELIGWLNQHDTRTENIASNKMVLNSLSQEAGQNAVANEIIKRSVNNVLYMKDEAPVSSSQREQATLPVALMTLLINQRVIYGDPSVLNRSLSKFYELRHSPDDRRSQELANYLIGILQVSIERKPDEHLRLLAYK